MGGGAETHDGFYLRFALGFGTLHMERKGEGQTDFGAFQGKSEIDGGVAVSEISVGGTPGGGFVVAGTFLSYRLPETTIKYENGVEEELGGPLNMIVLGGGVDWYPSPTGGFHFGGLLGFAVAVGDAPSTSPFENIGGLGGALSISVGYDWWIGDEWSIGVLGRATGAGVHGEATADTGAGEVTGKEDSSISAFTVSLCGVYH